MKNLIRKFIVWALTDEVKEHCRNEVLASPTIQSMMEYMEEQYRKMNKWKEESDIFLEKLRELDLEALANTVDSLEKSFSEYEQDFKEHQREIERNYSTSDDVNISINEANRDLENKLDSIESELEELKEKFFEKETTSAVEKDCSTLEAIEALQEELASINQNVLFEFGVRLQKAEKLLKQLDPRIVFEIPGAEDAIRAWNVSVSVSDSYFARPADGFELFSYNASGNYRKEHLPFYEINFNEAQK